MIEIRIAHNDKGFYFAIQTKCFRYPSDESIANFLDLSHREYAKLARKYKAYFNHSIDEYFFTTSTDRDKFIECVIQPRILMKVLNGEE